MYTCAHLRSIVHAFYIQHTYIHIRILTYYVHTYIYIYETYMSCSKYIHTSTGSMSQTWSGLIWNYYTHRHTRVTGPCSAHRTCNQWSGTALPNVLLSQGVYLRETPQSPLNVIFSPLTKLCADSQYPDPYRGNSDADDSVSSIQCTSIAIELDGWDAAEGGHDNLRTVAGLLNILECPFFANQWKWVARTCYTYIHE